MSREKNRILFTPGIIRNKKSSSPVIEFSSYVNDSIVDANTGSFRYDPHGTALKSSQQLNIDFSNFANHTFFNSAEAKVQKAFGKIINNTPFDTSESEISNFLDSLTGFEKHVFDSFPKHNGYLSFSGSTTTPGSFISINDFKGSNSFLYANNPTGESIIDPSTKSFTFEFYTCLPTQTNDNQIIFQKLSGSNGITLAISSSATKTNPSQNADLYFYTTSGTLQLSSTIEVQKGIFSHFACVYDNQLNGQLFIYKNGQKLSSSSYGRFGNIDFITSNALIASGSTHNQFIPKQTFSGSIDELRVWHEARSQENIDANRYSDIFAQQNLRLLYRFNEPTGSFSGGGSDLILDSSGNGLHSRVQNFSLTHRHTSSYGTPPIKNWSQIGTTVLFPTYIDIVNLNSKLLNVASIYDSNNPNIVTKLIPPHYFRDASSAEGFLDENGNIGNVLSSVSDEPGGANIGQPQIIAGLLYTFAETFDELKLFIDEFKRLLKVDYLTNDTISSQLMPWLSKYYGIDLPNFFTNSKISQFVDGKEIRLDRNNTTSLQTVQNILWRRIFADLPYILTTRGTHSSLRSVLANLGISVNGPIKIREFGGSKTKSLDNTFVRKYETAAMLNMSSSLSQQGTLDYQGFDSNRPYLIGTFNSGSRIEPGIPGTSGSFVNGVSNFPADGLQTSGSWACEAIYKFDNRISHPITQSLFRLHTTGTQATASKHGVLFNVVAKNSVATNSTTGSIELFGKMCSGTMEPLSLVLTGVNIFDGQKWHLTFGRQRNDEIDSYVSSSYFLRAGKMSPSGLEQFYATSSYYDDSSNCILKTLNSLNTSGTFIAIGSQSLSTQSGSFLNDVANQSVMRYTNFTGKISSIRFWSKSLTTDESIIHTKNFKSLGVNDPLVNFNFTSTQSGSFERLRQDISVDQPVTESNSSGQISLIDFSQNGAQMTGYSFEQNKRVIIPERFDFETLSANFHSGENPNKVRIRSFLDSENASTFNTAIAPLHSIPQNEEAFDDKRISIETSIVQALNEDIMCIFSTLDKLDNIIGSPELVFSQEYTELRNLRKIYFNRLTSKINIQSFFEFFKWFDDSISGLLEQMLPSNSKFKGSSYVIESHALERAKFTYKYYDMYLGEDERSSKESIYLQQLVGTIRKM